MTEAIDSRASTSFSDPKPPRRHDPRTGRSLKSTAPCAAGDCASPILARGYCKKHYYRIWHHGDLDLRATERGAALSFLAGVPAQGDGCIIWPFARTSAGYAQVAVPKTGGKRALVSRLICERTHGPAPTPKHQAAHSCGRGHTGCISPWHLSWKTPAENTAEKNTHGTMLRGVRHPRAKFSAAQVQLIRAATGLQREIGARFGVSQQCVQHIKSGKTYRYD